MPVRHSMLTRIPAAALGAILALGVSALMRWGSCGALAQTATGGAPPAARRAPLTLDARARARILDSLYANVLREYVEADTARLVVRAVQKRQQAGAYEALTNPTEFAEKVTADLRSVNGDRHLSLRYDPEGAIPGGPGAPVIVSRRVPGPGGPAGPGAPGGPVVVIREGPGPGGRGGPGGPPDSALANLPGMRGALRQNFGLTKLEILSGNVGYLAVSGFMGAPGADDAIAIALRFLERTDAIIIDVRQNRGGSGMMSHYLFSHFLPATPVPTIRVKSRASAEAEVNQSIAQVKGPRRTDVPLYVLTSRGTGSAAEEFSFVLKNLGRATLVGERTAGAGHMVRGFALPDGFQAGVSITRVSDPRTGREWEGVGVQPDIAVDADHALAVAHSAALRSLAGRPGAEGRRLELEWTAEWVAAKDRGDAPDAGRAAALVGDFEAERSVTLRGGRLYYRRGGFPASELVPLDDGRFALDGETRIRFVDGTPSPSLTVERANGSSVAAARVVGR